MPPRPAFPTGQGEAAFSASTLPVTNTLASDDGSVYSVTAVNSMQMPGGGGATTADGVPDIIDETQEPTPMPPVQDDQPIKFDTEDVAPPATTTYEYAVDQPVQRQYSPAQPPAAGAKPTMKILGIPWWVWAAGAAAWWYSRRN